MPTNLLGGGISVLIRRLRQPTPILNLGFGNVGSRMSAAAYRRLQARASATRTSAMATSAASTSSPETEGSYNIRPANLGNYNIGRPRQPGQLRLRIQQRRFQPGLRQRRQQQHQVCQHRRSNAGIRLSATISNRGSAPGTPVPPTPACSTRGTNNIGLFARGTRNIGVATQASETPGSVAGVGNTGLGELGTGNWGLWRPGTGNMGVANVGTYNTGGATWAAAGASPT